MFSLCVCLPALILSLDLRLLPLSLLPLIVIPSSLVIALPNTYTLAFIQLWILLQYH